MHDKRLSDISTIWSILEQTRSGSDTDAVMARQLLLERYGPAIRRYLGGVLRNEDEVDEVVQEFAVSLIRGDFRRADPSRGRFRSYLKTSLFHLVSKHRARQRKLPRSLAEGEQEVVDLGSSATEASRRFDESWRAEVLSRAWQSLADAQPAWHTALRLRADNPDLSSTEMAKQLAQHLGKPVSAESARQMLHRARERFGDLLIDFVAHSLESSSVEELEDELRDLNLLTYCQDAVQRFVAARKPETPRH